MSLILFFAICILGCDFMIFVLLKWLYGEKRREPPKRSALGKQTTPLQSRLHYLPARSRTLRRVPGQIIYGGFEHAGVRGHGAARRGR